MYGGSVGHAGAAAYSAHSVAPAPESYQQQSRYPAQPAYPAQHQSAGVIPPAGVIAGAQPAYPAQQPVAGAFGQQFDFGVDKSHTVAKEEWPQFQGNSACISPVFSTFPANRVCRKVVSVPLTIQCKPLGRLYNAEGEEVPCPVSDIPNGGSIVRCTAPACRAYVNPFALWSEEGRRWKCPNCRRQNDLITRTKEYFVGRLDEYGRRRDRWERPELHSGTMEFVAPQEYTMRPPMRPTFCFLIDVTKLSVQRGVVDAVCQSIKTAIEAMPTNPGETHERAQIMICTFDTDTHVYQLPNKRQDGTWSSPTVLTHPGACAPYAVTSHTNENIVVEVQENKERIYRLLDVIPSIWRQQNEHRSGVGASLREMELYLSKIGGRILTFAASRPAVGDINCTVTPDGERMAAKAEAALKPANPRWKQLGCEMAQDKEAHCPVGVELYAFCPPPNEQTLDLATLVGLPAATGHSVYQFHAASYDTIDTQRLTQAVTWSVAQSNIAWECCVRVRVSRGWRISNDQDGWNNFDAQEIRDSLVSYPCMSEDHSIGFNLELVDAQTPEAAFDDTHVHVQVALLYTSTQGSRRIRLQSLAIPVHTNPLDVWNTVSPTNLFQQLSFTTLWMARQSSHVAMDYLHNRLEQILQAMKQAQYPYTEMVMRDLATYSLGLTESDALRDVSKSRQDMTPDTRVVLWYNFMRMMNADTLLAACYPYHVAPEQLEQYIQRILAGRAGAVGSIGTVPPMRR